MNVREYRAKSLVSLFALLGIVSTVAFCADKKTVLQNANLAYYNLKAQGLSEFSCQVRPDWDAAFKDIQMDALVRDQVLPIAKKMRFQVVVGPSGAALVSHQSPEAPSSEDVATRVRDMSSGMEQMVTGFFETWSQIMINPPLPGADNEYQMEESGGDFRFTAAAASTHVAVSMSHDFVIDSIEVKSPKLEGVVRPKFERREGALVLVGYDAKYKTDSASQQLAVKVEYQEVEGLALPRTITMTMSLPQGRIDEPITFTDCRAKKR